MATSLPDLASSADTSRRPSLSPAEVFGIARAREAALSRLLMAFVTVGTGYQIDPAAIEEATRLSEEK